MMLLTVRARIVSFCLAGALGLALASTACAQTNYFGVNGTEYLAVGALLGDQVSPDAAISPTNGVIVWQDNGIDGSGWGIGACRLDATLSPLSAFRVNSTVAGDQVRPRVALLKNGAAAVVWQGGLSGYQHIYARFFTTNNTFLTTNDILVSTATNRYQINPALTVLTNGTVAVVWASFNQVATNSMQDIYCQILSTNGTKIGTNFLVNQFTAYNQRTPAIAALKNGGFIAAWVSEQERTAAPNLGSNTVFTLASALTLATVDIYARTFNSAGTPTGNEYLVNTDSSVCANPAIAVAADGSSLVAWSAKDTVNPTNSWDIHARIYSSSGVAGAAFLVNTHTIGDQYVPEVKCNGLDYLVSWTSLGQDGSREGVYGQFIHNNGAPVGSEFLINTTTFGQQMLPALAADGVSQFLCVWTSFSGAASSFDLYGQRYINVASILQPMSAPFVWAPFVISNNVYQPQLVVSWPVLVGLPVASYEVYVDGAGSPSATLTNNSWTMTAANGLKASSTHAFALDYLTTDGRHSPISPATTATNWSGVNYYGIPFEWMEDVYGFNIANWPTNVNAPLAPGGMSLADVFLSGGDPMDPSTWLKQQLVKTPKGMSLVWNTLPGATYQVQATTDFKAWSNVGTPRFAAGTSDSIELSGTSATYYHIKLLR